MEILAPRHGASIPVSAGQPAGRTLVITDRRDVASAAESIGVACRLAEMDVGDGRYDTLVVAWGDGAAVDYGEAVRFAEDCLALLHAVRDAGRPVHLVTLSAETNVLSALLDGMAASVALELPLTHTTVEIEGPVTGERLRTWLAAAAAHSGARLSVSGDRVARLEHVPAALAPVPPADVFGGGPLVVIGGAGGVGRELCRYLSERCDSPVIVLGRRTPDRATLTALREAGARSYLSVPAHEPEALTEALRYVHGEFGPIKAVFNLAGVLDDCLLHNLTPDRLAGVLAPKVAVALNLAELSGPHRPELVVHFSSLTSVTGNVGQAAYGAANAFLDRLAPRHPGWHSVNWGWWDTDGMRPADDESGLRAMPPREACDVLVSAVAAGVRRLVVFDGEVLLDPPTDEPAATTSEPAASTDQRAGAREWLRALVVRQTGLKHLGDDENLLDAGVDSVGSVRISRDIETRLELSGSSRLSRAVVFEYPTVAALADHLLETVPDRLAPHATSTATEPKPTAAQPASTVAEPRTATKPTRTTAEPTRTAAPDPYRPDDVAIIGLAGEFPGGADVTAFWRSLLAGTEAVRVVPPDRWDWRANYALEPDEPGATYGRHGGFLDHALDFDPVFFTITPVEATAMDPQERRFLQTAYHALEDSGYFAAPTTDVGVFVAAMYGHYQDLSAPDQAISSSFAAIANRVSHTLDLHGPSVALDTMCSGSLTALHLAVGAIRAGDCALAVAGGVNIMAHPGKLRFLSEGKFLSPTGHCHSFGVAADGYVPGEGTGAVVLKSLSAARRDGDRIHAVIRATAVNAAGRTAGFTVPSERAQHRVISSALSRAGVDPAEVSYVEAHGTGTRLGDPIEIRALRRAYGGPEQGTAYLGTVKSNIGHLESAAAMAGLAKVVRQLADRTLAPTLHCELENPDLHLDTSRFTLVKQARPWPAGSGPTRFAGLSSFGAGGAGGHVIIQEYLAPARPAPAFTRCFIPLSGRDEQALSRRVDELLAFLRATPDVPLYGLSYTLCRARQHFRVRRGHWVESVEQLTRLLDGTATAESAPTDSAWASAASAYLAGDKPDFTGLFPVPMLVDAPLYPFAADRYVAASLDHAAKPADQPDSLVLAPVWQAATEPAAGSVDRVLVLADRDQDLPPAPSGTQLIRVVPDDDDAARRAMDHLTRETHLYWVNVCRNWTVESILAVAKAIQASRVPSTILTVTSEDDDPETHAMAGFFHGLAEENPHIHAIRARRPGPVFADGWRPLLAELTSSADTEVRWADGKRWRRGLDEVRLGRRPRLRDGGTYLVTGGLGTVGRAIAEHLVERYRATVITVGRSTPDAVPPGVHHERADITSAEQTRDLIDRVRARFGGLDGVIHSAGVTADALVPNKSTVDAKNVLAPKVDGTRNLDRFTADLRLDFFCVFSSISSLLGNVGQSDYIAANRFLDEFAADRAGRVARGERTGYTLSINWPLWTNTVDDALAGYLRAEFGMAPLTEQVGARLFADLLDGLPDDCHQVLACAGDVPRMRQRLVRHAEPAPVQPEPPRPAAVTASTDEIAARLVALVRAQTGLRRDDIPVDGTWGDLGYSSVMLQQLAQRLGPEFGVDTPPNALFKYRSIALLSEYLRDNGVSGVSSAADERQREPEDMSERDGYAIVGMSGVLPGGRDLAEYWRLLVENRSAIRRVERWDGEYFAGVIDGFDEFDHAFFGLSGREALLMDPQHRLFLQAAYNALLDAGHAPSAVRNVGVFAGVQFSEYQAALRDNDDWAHPYTVTGNAHTMLANRVSYALDLTGPSQTVDTACSSGLVALNRGVLSLAAGECDIAVVGAVSVLVDPAATDAASGLGVLSPDFRCATFDKDANGYVRAEGVGCVVVRRLADAVRDGDTVLAVIERVAENHGGRANSLTAPNPEAQVALLTRAYTPELAARVTNIETHGTGTRLGDPIEVSALRTAFERLAPGRGPGAITLGAVKTNIGHLEPAAGMAGLLKTLLCLRHRTLPANINFAELNPLIELDSSPFRLLMENEDWKDSGPLVAGVSSFGFGGSNAHVVLSEAPTQPPGERPPRPCRLVTLSARSVRSLTAMRNALAEWLRDTEAYVADIAYTLDTGRDHFEYRLCWLVSDTADLRRQVEAARPEQVARCQRRTGARPAPDLSDYRAALESVRDRYLDGEEIDWPALFDDGRYRRLSLPGYAFEANRFWFE